MKFTFVFTCLLFLVVSKTDALVKQYGQIDGFQYIGRALAFPSDKFENYSTKIVNFPEVFDFNITIRKTYCNNLFCS